MNPPTLVILRGVPGSGKTTVANLLACIPGAVVVSADLYPGRYTMDIDNNPVFVPNETSAALDWCEEQTRIFMRHRVPCIIVDNTSLSRFAVERYASLAAQFNYRFIILKVEGNHKSVHNVPEEVIQNLKEAYEPWD